MLQSICYPLTFRQHEPGAARRDSYTRRFVGQTILSFPSDRNYLPVGCDAAFAEANIAPTTVKAFVLSIRFFSLSVYSWEKERPTAMRKQHMPDHQLTTRTPSRYYDIIFPEIPRNAFVWYFYYFHMRTHATRQHATPICACTLSPS